MKQGSCGCNSTSEHGLATRRLPPDLPTDAADESNGEYCKIVRVHRVVMHLTVSRLD